MPWPEGWSIQNCLRRKCEILIHTCAFRRCLTFCRCSPQISLDGPMPSEALACLIKWQCEGDGRAACRFARVRSACPVTPDVPLRCRDGETGQFPTHALKQTFRVGPFA